MFSAKDTQLREWTVTDPQGYATMIAVYNLDASRKPDPVLFQIPMRGRISDTPSREAKTPI